MHLRAASLVSAMVVAWLAVAVSTVGSDPRQPAAAGQPLRKRSVWDGVFTQPQAVRGAESYRYSCSTCHGPDLEGDAGRDVPALDGDEFVGGWNGRTIKDLFDLIRKAMPKDSPGSLKPETYADIVAFLLQANEFPAGTQELSIDSAALERIGIEKVPPIRQ